MRVCVCVCVVVVRVWVVVQGGNAGKGGGRVVC